MNFKPEGLTIPDCKCFKRDLIGMNANINSLSAFTLRTIVVAYSAIGVCPKAKDYFFASLIADLMLVLAVPSDAKYTLPHKDKVEAAYERIRPLIMQRLEYADAMVDDIREG